MWFHPNLVAALALLIVAVELAPSRQDRSVITAQMIVAACALLVELGAISAWVYNTGQLSWILASAIAFTLICLISKVRQLKTLS
jgi:hypothetical protein